AGQPLAPVRRERGRPARRRPRPGRPGNRLPATVTGAGEAGSQRAARNAKLAPTPAAPGPDTGEASEGRPMNVDALVELYRHMEWADAAVWKAVLASDAGRADAEVQRLFHHLHVVQRAFLRAWRGE